jgi:hypothetical protein
MWGCLLLEMTTIPDWGEAYELISGFDPANAALCPPAAL